jgi:hypothetical protein
MSNAQNGAFGYLISRQTHMEVLKMVALRNHPKLDHVSIQIEAYGFGVPPFYETPI